MKVQILSVIFFFLLIQLEAQNTNGKVIYKVKQIPIQKYEENNRYENFTSSFSSDFDYLKYNLDFNKSRSAYYLADQMNIEGTNLRKASIIAGRGYYFIDLEKNKFIKQTDFIGDMYLINLSDPYLKWKILKEQKTILNHVCLKAVATKVVKNGLDIKLDIVAWFTPGIPASFGPKGYFGLPGLILELQERDLNFYAVDIISKPDTEVKEPTKGIAIEEQDLERKAEDSAKKMFKFN